MTEESRRGDDPERPGAEDGAGSLAGMNLAEVPSRAGRGKTIADWRFRIADLTTSFRNRQSEIRNRISSSSRIPAVTRVTGKPVKSGRRVEEPPRERRNQGGIAELACAHFVPATESAFDFNVSHVYKSR